MVCGRFVPDVELAAYQDKPIEDRRRRVSVNASALGQRLEILDSKRPQRDEFLSKPHAKALVLNLSEESSFEWEIPTSYLEAYVSGPALAARIWACFVGPEIDNPLSYEVDNPMVFAASALSGSGMPGCELTSCAFRSPVTGALCFNIVENSVGMRLVSLGYAALIVIGRFRRPTIVTVGTDGVSYNTSESFIGFTVSQVEKFLGTGSMTTAMSIGVAGEQKVPYSIVVCEGASLGRGGLGAVFGFKNVKSISIAGQSSLEPKDDVGSDADKDEAFSRLYKACDGSVHCREMKAKGSSYLIGAASRYGWAPVDNFRYRTDPRLFHLGGDEVARRYGNGHSGCMNCPIMCRHWSSEGYAIPDYASLLMLGSNVGCFDMDSIMERHALCLDLGLDPVSMGNVLGWSKQAQEECIMDILGADFDFKDNSKVLPVIEMVAKRIGVGEPLSFGTLALGKAFGDESFAYTMRGLECGPFDYRGAFSQALSDCQGLFLTNQFEIVSRLCIQDHASWALFNERASLGLASYGVLPALLVPTTVDNSKWNRFTFRMLKTLPKSVIKHLKPTILADCIASVIKRPVVADDVFGLGDACWVLLYEINMALGFDMLENVVGRIPSHFCIDPDSNSSDGSIVPFFDLMERYCHFRKKVIADKVSDFNAG